MNDYQKDLRKRQQEHLQKVRRRVTNVPCAHDGCAQCHGTGVRLDGSSCVHMLYCRCPKCNPLCMSV